MSFPLPSAWLVKRSQIHVGSLEGFVLSPTNSKRSTVFHIFSFADVGGCLGVSFVIFLWFLLFDFSAYMKSYRRHIKLFFIESPCATCVQAQPAADVCYCREESFVLFLGFFLLFYFTFLLSSPQALIVVYFCKPVCGLGAGSYSCF